MVTRQRRHRMPSNGAEIVNCIVHRSHGWIAVAALLWCSSTALGASTDRCAELAKLTLPDAAIGVAETTSPGSFVPARHAATDTESRAFQNMPAFCRVALVLRPSADSDIQVEVWMPASGWNGKFQGQGNGGFAGSVDYFAMALAIRAGYA